jgi:hypothetical protein
MFSFLAEMECIYSFLVITQMLGNCANDGRTWITTKSFLEYSSKFGISKVDKLFRASA